MARSASFKKRFTWFLQASFSRFLTDRFLCFVLASTQAEQSTFLFAQFSRRSSSSVLRRMFHKPLGQAKHRTMKRCNSARLGWESSRLSRSILREHRVSEHVVRIRQISTAIKSDNDNNNNNTQQYFDIRLVSALRSLDSSHEGSWNDKLAGFPRLQPNVMQCILAPP